MISVETYAAMLSKTLGSHYEVLQAELVNDETYRFKVKHGGRVAYASQWADPKVTQDDALPLMADDCAAQLRIHFTGRA